MSQYKSLVKYLHKAFPEIRFKVYRRKLNGALGACELGKGMFRIVLRSDLPEHALLVVLVHEFAHVITWHIDEHATDHGALFGVGYARVWRAYLNWIDGV